MNKITAVHFRGACGSHWGALIDGVITEDDPLIAKLKSAAEKDTKWSCRHCTNRELTMKLETIETNEPFENHYIDTTDSHAVILDENWLIGFRDKDTE